MITPAEAVATLLNLPVDAVLVLQDAHVSLFAAAARGEVDLNALARAELAARGLDQGGRWVGFDAALSAAQAAHQVR